MVIKAITLESAPLYVGAIITIPNHWLGVGGQGTVLGDRVYDYVCLEWKEEKVWLKKLNRGQGAFKVRCTDFEVTKETESEEGHYMICRKDFARFHHAHVRQKALDEVRPMAPFFLLRCELFLT